MLLLRALQCDSLFQDLGKLKSRPAHLGVFLRYIFSQADPSPLVRAGGSKLGEVPMGRYVRALPTSLGPAGAAGLLSTLLRCRLCV